MYKIWCAWHDRGRTPDARIADGTLAETTVEERARFLEISLRPASVLRNTRAPVISVDSALRAARATGVAETWQRLLKKFHANRAERAGHLRSKGRLDRGCHPWYVHTWNFREKMVRN